MYNVELCHLGDNCEPGIILDDILYINKKYPFMLGHYSFNHIVAYLRDNNYEKIYNKNHLKVEANNLVSHNVYNFKFNHDYKTSNGDITNYDHIKTRFDEKIKNFREMIQSPKMTIFVNFTNNVNGLDINGMVEWLKINKSNSHIIIFTNNNYDAGKHNSPNLSIIKLEKSYASWWEIDKPKRRFLYKEIYEKFINCLNNKNIANNFPKSFKDTSYGQRHKDIVN